MRAFVQITFFLMAASTVSVGAQTALAGRPSPITKLLVDPPAISLVGPALRFSLLISGEDQTGQIVDLTHKVSYSIEDNSVARISTDGWVTGVQDGRTTVIVEYDELRTSVNVKVNQSRAVRQYHFENDIIPIFSKFGCNSSGCHGKAEGQNGFKLSVFGFDPEADLHTLNAEGRGRRVFPAAPEESLLLLKSSGGSPHGGGVRILRGSAEYQLISDWMAAGMPTGAADAPHVVSIDVSPRERQMLMEGQQQLRVLAKYSDGQQVDVTRHTRFQTNNEALADVDEFGEVTVGDVPGEAAIMASYMGAVNVFRVLIPQTNVEAVPTSIPANNFVDELVDAKLQKLNIGSSDLCSDEDFLRRLYLDVIGTLPSADECRTFLSDSDPNKRTGLLAELLQRSEYARYWSLKWADLLRVDRRKLGHKGAYNYYRWIRDSLSQNKPFDQFARELLTAEGPLSESPAGYFYKAIDDPGQAASTISQVFLGVRIECAQCHHHPSDRWSQSDYYGMKGLFSQVDFKSSQRGDMLQASKTEPILHPRTGSQVMARPLGDLIPDSTPSGDRRHVLANWMTSPENEWFSKNVVNRMWAHFLGRGIVEPVDDIRSTNPPTNPELLDALSQKFIEQGFDLHKLIEAIVSSRTYQLSSKPTPNNRRDEQNYSRALLKPLDAEVLLDAISQTTGIDEKFAGVPKGARAIDLWDSQVSHYFLKLFGRPERSTACQCERTAEPNVSQILHVLNSPQIHAKLEHEGGRVAQLVQQNIDDSVLIRELYLSFLSRFPTSQEMETISVFLNSEANRRQAAEDVVWGMLNSTEFLFNH